MEVAMATALRPDAYPHIEQDPAVRGGKACIAGTRIAVKDVVGLARQGMRPEEMAAYFSSRPLSLAEVHAALTYYYDHQGEIDAELAADRGWEERHEQAKAKHNSRRQAR
jgi:uncharacterized protein (DUF433 family)